MRLYRYYGCRRPYQGASYETAAKIQTARISWAVCGSGTDMSKRPDGLETLDGGITGYGSPQSSQPFVAPLPPTLCYTCVGNFAVRPSTFPHGVNHDEGDDALHLRGNAMRDYSWSNRVGIGLLWGLYVSTAALGLSLDVISGAERSLHHLRLR